LAAEHYNRLSRLLDRKVEVELEIDVRARFHDDDEMAYNTIAEIPGTDKQAEVVMLGAHLDSWHGAPGPPTTPPARRSPWKPCAS